MNIYDFIYNIYKSKMPPYKKIGQFTLESHFMLQLTWTIYQK